MPRRPPIPHLAVVICLACASVSAPAEAQEEPQVRERRVLVWRGGPEQVVEIEAAPGRRGFLGVGLIDLTPELRSFFGAPEDRGVLVSEVLDASPARAAGIRVGDVLTAIHDQPLRGVMVLQMAVAKARDGDEVELRLRRDRKELTVSVQLEVRDRSQFDISPLVDLDHSLHGPLALELNADSAREIDIDTSWMEGVVGRVGQRLADASVLEQLEAMRIERLTLQEKLDRMEERLQQLEAELDALHDGDR